MFLKAKRVLAVGAALVLIVAWFIHGILANTYVNYPRSPDPGVGRTVPYAVKGIVVYVTQGQQDLLSWLTWIEIGSGMVAALVILVHRGDPFRSKK